jgi:hypothetical protein
MTDPRLQGTQPIDDEVPYRNAKDVARDEAPRDEDAVVTPAAAERERTNRDPGVVPERRRPETADPGETGAP